MISIQTPRRYVWRPLWQLPGRSELIWALARRELGARYRGSLLGLVWPLVTPLVMIAIYTFIFAEFFGVRFGRSISPWDYALYLFCGLLPWMMFQESVQLSVNTIVAHSNLVKKVVFPIETLPVAQTLTGVAHQLFGTVALLIAVLAIRGQLHITLVWLPLLLMLQSIMVLGAAWFVAATGVFLRDTAQVIGLVLTTWMYLTPIIYPEAIVPERYRGLINLNPWSGLIRSYRRIMLEGVAPLGMDLAYFAVFALVCFVCGYWWFARTRKDFADVV